MKAIRNLVVGAQAFGLAMSTALTVEVVPDGDLLRAKDEPQVVLPRSGWGWVQGSVPAIVLTPDRLTNAMIIVFRWHKGENLPNGRRAPEETDFDHLKEYLRESNKNCAGDSTSGAIIRQESIGGRDVALCGFDEKGFRKELYAFGLKGLLIEILLLAKDQEYLDRGSAVARRIVERIDLVAPTT